MKIFVLIVVLLPLILGTNANARPMKNYSIDFPQNVLRYSLPYEVANKIPPLVQAKQLSQFLPTDKDYLAHGFLEIAGTLHDFTGPFWVGAYGSLKFHFIVQKRSSRFDGEIVTLDGLDRYIRWWTHEVNPSYSFGFGRVMVGNSKWLSRSHNNFPEAAALEVGQREELEVISIPIDNETFLDVGFIITEWVPGSANKWKQKAEELRDAIKATIVFEEGKAAEKGSNH